MTPVCLLMTLRCPLTNHLRVRSHQRPPRRVYRNEPRFQRKTTFGCWNLGGDLVSEKLHLSLGGRILSVLYEGDVSRALAFSEFHPGTR